MGQEEALRLVQKGRKPLTTEEASKQLKINRASANRNLTRLEKAKDIFCVELTNNFINAKIEELERKKNNPKALKFLIEIKGKYRFQGIMRFFSKNPIYL